MANIRLKNISGVAQTIEIIPDISNREEEFLNLAVNEEIDIDSAVISASPDIYLKINSLKLGVVSGGPLPNQNFNVPNLSISNGVLQGVSQFDVGAWVLLNDIGIQFSGGQDGANGFNEPNHYVGAPNTDITVPLVVTNGSGIKNILNNFSTVLVSITGGTAPGIKINGGNGPVVVSFSHGLASVKVSSTGVGTILLGLSNPTHPFNNLNAQDTAIITVS